MIPFIKLLHFNASNGSDQVWLQDGPTAKWNSLPALYKAMFLLRQAFALQYVKFITNSNSKLLQQYKVWLDELLHQLSINPEAKTPIIHRIIDTITSFKQPYDIGQHAIDRYEGYLDTPIVELPCTIPRDAWEPFYRYCEQYCCITKMEPYLDRNLNNIDRTKLPSYATDSAKLILPELFYRNIDLDCGNVCNNERFIIDAKTYNLDDVMYFNVFGFLCFFKWSSHSFDNISGILARLPLTNESSGGLLEYIRDCVYYDGSFPDPAVNVTNYHMSSSLAQTFVSFLLKLRTRDNVEFHDMSVITRLLLVDTDGGIGKRLYKQLQLTAEGTALPTHSVEELAGTKYAIFQPLYMKQAELASIDFKDAPSTDDITEEPDTEAGSDTKTSDQPESEDTTDQSPPEESSTDDLGEMPLETDPSSDQMTDTNVEDPSITDGGVVKIGNITITLAETPSLRTTIFRDQVGRYLDQIITLKPEGFTILELDLLKRLRLHWLYLYSVDTVVAILDKVFKGKKLPAIEIQ